MIKLYIDLLYDFVWYKDKIVYVNDMDVTKHNDIQICYLNDHGDYKSEWINFNDIYFVKDDLSFIDKVFNLKYISNLKKYINS